VPNLQHWDYIRVNHGSRRSRAMGLLRTRLGRLHRDIRRKIIGQGLAGC
jgi:hypothetical protein